MDLSQSSLAWTLVTAAVRLAQDAGYHRLPPCSVAPEVTEKRRLFWFMYCVERGMAINLGRSPSIPDHDIQSDRPKFPVSDLLNMCRVKSISSDPPLCHCML